MKKTKTVNLIRLLALGICLSFPLNNYSQTKKSQNKMENSNQVSKNKEAIRSLYENLLNERHLDQLGNVIDASFVGIRGEKGPEGFKGVLEGLIMAFPDIKWSIEDLIAADNKVVVRWTWKGTFQNSFRGYQPTQKEMTNSAISIYEFVNGKATQAWIQSDQLGFLLAAGAIPPSLIAPPAKK
jgi:predicted ester cyclase